MQANSNPIRALVHHHLNPPVSYLFSHSVQKSCPAVSVEEFGSPRTTFADARTVSSDSNLPTDNSLPAGSNLPADSSFSQFVSPSLFIHRRCTYLRSLEIPLPILRSNNSSLLCKLQFSRLCHSESHWQQWVDSPRETHSAS